MSAAPDAATDAAKLSPRQRDCLRLVHARRTSKEIGRQLGLSPGTADQYLADATRALSARNRRHAAELFHALAPPCETELRNLGIVGEVPPPAPLAEPEPRDWRELLPVRRKGVFGNDLSFAYRLVWIFGLAIAGAIGFGMLAIGIHLVAVLLFGARP